jgi:tetratricopeptide (TPR) repeat protein
MTARHDTDPPRVYRLLGREPTGLGLGGRPLSRFVGRERELAALDGLLARVVAGSGQAVILMGEPGVGKSRVLFEFRQRVRASECTWLEGRCLSSATTTPYGPVIQAVRQALGVAEDDEPDAIATRTRDQLKALALDPEAHAPYLQALLGLPDALSALSALSPEAVRLRTFEALHRLLLHLSLLRPLALAVEDRHWIDPTSDAYLQGLVDRLAGARVLLLATSRPGPAAPWLRHSHASQLALPPLSRQDSLAVVRSIASADRLSDVTATSISTRADGNPFFLEELSWAALTQGAEVVTGAAPRSVTDVLRARIDRLPEATRQVLTVAAVLGREFSTTLLQAVAPDPDRLDPELAALKRLELLHDQPQASEPALVFKHALTQEAAYERLEASERTRLHEAAGRALERLFAERLDTALDQLAYHYGLSTDHEKAVAYLTRVADRAAAGYALEEALTALDHAVAHAQRLTGLERERQLVMIRTRYGLPMMMLGRLVECRDLLFHHWPDVERLGDPALTGPYCFWLAHVLDHLGRWDDAIPWAERALTEARCCGDTLTQARAHYDLSINALCKGRLLDSVDHGHRATALFRPTSDTFFLGHATWFTGFALVWLGRFSDALTAAQDTRDVGDRTGDPRTQCYGDQLAGWSRGCLGDLDSASVLLKRALNEAPDPLAALLVRGPLGLIQIEAGQPGSAIESLEQGALVSQEMRATHLEAWMTAWLGEAHLAAGRFERARSLAAQALAQAREVGFPIAEGLARRLEGRLAAAAGAYDEAASELHAALQMFTRLGARYEVARTHLDLATVTRALGHVEDAASHLTEARALFATLEVPRWVARADERARELGLEPLTGAALREPAEGSGDDRPA